MRCRDLVSNVSLLWKIGCRRCSNSRIGIQTLGSAQPHDIIHMDVKPEKIVLREGHAVAAGSGIALRQARSSTATSLLMSLARKMTEYSVVPWATLCSSWRISAVPKRLQEYPPRLTSLSRSQDLDRIHAGRPPRRDVACSENHGEEERGRAHEDNGIPRARPP
jgi:hypothetical protein